MRATPEEVHNVHEVHLELAGVRVELEATRHPEGLEAQGANLVTHSLGRQLFFEPPLLGDPVGLFGYVLDCK